MSAELKEALRWALEWIDAVPKDAPLPAMPGFDRDYVNALLDRAEQPSDPVPLAHGHRDDWYLMANARRLAMLPIAKIKAMPNWVFAMRLFATGSTSAHQICRDAVIDPDRYDMVRIVGQQTKDGGNG